MEDMESLERARVDVELVGSAYPDEVKVDKECSEADFPLIVTLKLSETAHIRLELVDGYPTKSTVQVASYRSNPNEKARIEKVVSDLKRVATECLREEKEGCFACCAAALEAWGDLVDKQTQDEHPANPLEEYGKSISNNHYDWVTGDPLVDRKSTFLPHVCQISSDADVPWALKQLLESHSKYRRATHNMV